MHKVKQFSVDFFFLFMAAFFLIFALANFNYHARLLPVITGIPCVALFAANLWLRMRSKAEDAGDKDKSQDVYRREIRTITWMIGTAASLYLLGFFVTIHAFTIFFLRWGIRESWKVTAGVTLAMFLMYYIVFVRIVHTDFWPGLFFKGLF